MTSSPFFAAAPAPAAAAGFATPETGSVTGIGTNAVPAGGAQKSFGEVLTEVAPRGDGPAKGIKTAEAGPLSTTGRAPDQETTGEISPDAGLSTEPVLPVTAEPLIPMPAGGAVEALVASLRQGAVKSATPKKSETTGAPPTEGKPAAASSAEAATETRALTTFVYHGHS